MARQFNGSLDFAQSSSAVNLSAVNKFTLSFWLWWNSYANDDRTAFEHSSDFNSVTDGWIVDPNGTAVFSKFSIGHRGNVGYSLESFTRPSAATWHQYVVTFDKTQTSSEVNVYVDGVVPSGIDRSFDANNTNNFGNYVLNFMNHNGGGSLGAGKLAEISIWPGTILDSNEINSLSLGYAPTFIRPASLGWYWPMHFPDAASEPELIKGNNADLIETSSADHPITIYPAPTIIEGVSSNNLVQIFDRVKETTTITGTTAFTLLGAISGGFITFSSVMSINTRCYYCCENSGFGEWEVGIGTLTNSTTLARNIIKSSSNNNNIVNFSSGTKNIFITAPAASISPMANTGDMVYLNATGQVTRLPIGNTGQVLKVSNSLPVWM